VFKKSTQMTSRDVQTH